MNCDKPQRAYISYMKASCGEYAREISKALFEYGYGVFFDRKSPRSGEFDKNLYLAINNSEWFILILDKHIFEGWNDEKNWIHIELGHALEENKKLILIKTPGFDIEKEIPKELHPKLLSDVTEMLELDTKEPDKTAPAVRKIFEAQGRVGKFEKAVNRIFSGIYLWRIILFMLVGFLMMTSKISDFYSMYLDRSHFEIAYVFDRFGPELTFRFNYVYILLGTFLCGAFMFLTRKVFKLDIIPLFLADVAGVAILSMSARKITDTVFELGKAMYWSGAMGQAVWSMSEQVAVYMVFITLVIQVFLYLFKRRMNYV